MKVKPRFNEGDKVEFYCDQCDVMWDTGKEFWRS